MRRAMAEAEVGDDVFGDDPTVIALEERAAELLGKEAGLFVASRHDGQSRRPARPPRPRPGDHRRRASTTWSSTRPPATRSSSARASARLDDRPDGTIDPAAIEAAFRDPTDPHEPITGLITLENTHAHSMGQPLTPAYTREVAAIAPRPRRPAPRRRGAVLERGRRPARAASPRATSPDPADTVTFCLSKGLGCPVGSVVVGIARRHLAGAARAQAGRRRDAPGRGPRRGRTRRPVATARTA